MLGVFNFAQFLTTLYALTTKNQIRRCNLDLVKGTFR